jgi:cysteine desulfuration protein SufE
MSPTGAGLPSSIERILARFRLMGREEKMQALLAYARKLEPLPERFRALDRTQFSVPECQTPVAIFPEFVDGQLHFYAEVDTRQSPTVAAFLSVVFAAVNDQPPAVTLAIPDDFVREVMQSMGLGTREFGLDALVHRLKHHARAVEDGPPPPA